MKFIEPLASAVPAEGVVLRLLSEKMGGSSGIVMEPAMADEGCAERSRSLPSPAVHVLEISRVETTLPVESRSERTERGSGDTVDLGSRGSGDAVFSSAGSSKLRF